MIGWLQFNTPQKRFRPFIILVLFACSLSLLVNEVIYQKGKQTRKPTSFETTAKPSTPVQFKDFIAKNPATTSAQTGKTVQLASVSGVNVPIIIYHYVGGNPNPSDLARNVLSVLPIDFENQMAYLKNNHYEAIDFETLQAAIDKKINLPAKPIILTFDDGYIDFYYNAFPILEKYQFKATVFIPTGLVGKPAYLTWEMISTMTEIGRISFQSHSVSHRPLTSLSDSELATELTESRQVLQSRLGRPVNFIAYPYGSFDERVIFFAKNAGYRAAISTLSGEFESTANIYYLPRVRPGSGSVGSFIERLEGKVR